LNLVESCRKVIAVVFEAINASSKQKVRCSVEGEAEQELINPDHATIARSD
jgi:hypothetical protein